MLLAISSLRFPDQFASSKNIFQNTNFKISNLRLAVLIKVVFIKKVYLKSETSFSFKTKPFCSHKKSCKTAKLFS